MAAVITLSLLFGMLCRLLPSLEDRSFFFLLFCFNTYNIEGAFRFYLSYAVRFFDELLYNLEGKDCWLKKK